MIPKNSDERPNKRVQDQLRRRLIYSGRVQGVGFRYTTASIARRYAVSGFVRNLSDGTVELVAEGTAVALDEFFDEIASTLGRNIAAAQITEFQTDEKLNRFEIRY